MICGTLTASGNQVLIRAMDYSDLDSVIQIEKSSFPHPWTRDHFISELQRDTVSRCYVAVTADNKGTDPVDPCCGEGRISGYLMAWHVADELHITNLAVSPEVRRRGIAVALLRHSLKEAAEAGAIWCQLDVRTSNAPARELYGQLGFKPFGIRKGYYRDGEDAVVMGKDLKNLIPGT